MNITVAGTGYVGLSNAVLFAQYHKVTALDVIEEKVTLINQRISPIGDKEIEEYLKTKPLDLKATLDPQEAYEEADIVFVCTPTNYDVDTHHFDTSSVEAVIEDVLRLRPTALIVIKSTIPIGFTQKMRETYEAKNIIFSPEFLREGKALYDNLHPSRIIVGDLNSQGQLIADLMKECSLDDNTPVLLTDSTEAEAVKLFANNYLAMRVAFFNELDSYCMNRNLDTKQIIQGVSLDPRIGDYYNNPSFGYGGYCLPKDTKQLLANFNNTPQNIIGAIVQSNDTRKQFLVDTIIKQGVKKVGAYRLIMKSGSDNFRDSAIVSVLELLVRSGIDVIVYEPQVKEETFGGFLIVNDLKQFKKESELIIVNRLENDDLKDISSKIFSRDLYHRD